MKKIKWKAAAAMLLSGCDSPVLAVDESLDSTPFRLFGGISFGYDASKARDILGEPIQYLEGHSMHYSYRDEETTLYIMDRVRSGRADIFVQLPVYRMVENIEGGVS